MKAKKSIPRGSSLPLVPTFPSFTTTLPCAHAAHGFLQLTSVTVSVQLASNMQLASWNELFRDLSTFLSSIFLCETQAFCALKPGLWPSNSVSRFFCRGVFVFAERIGKPFFWRAGNRSHKGGNTRDSFVLHIGMADSHPASLRKLQHVVSCEQTMPMS